MKPIKIEEMSKALIRWNGDPSDCYNKLYRWWLREFGQVFWWSDTVRTIDQGNACLYLFENGWCIINEYPEDGTRVIAVYSPRPFAEMLELFNETY